MWHVPHYAFILLVHGMSEHALRYRETAEFLNSMGFSVLAYDLRGHGSTSTLNNTPHGFVAKEAVWSKFISDIEAMHSYL